jgi:hypothetical protein
MNKLHLESLSDKENIKYFEGSSTKPRLFEIGDVIELTLSGTGKYTDNAIGKYTMIFK